MVGVFGEPLFYKAFCNNISNKAKTYFVDYIADSEANLYVVCINSAKSRQNITNRIKCPRW